MNYAFSQNKENDYCDFNSQSQSTAYNSQRQEQMFDRFCSTLENKLVEKFTKKFDSEVLSRIGNSLSYAMNSISEINKLVREISMEDIKLDGISSLINKLSSHIKNGFSTDNFDFEGLETTISFYLDSIDKIKNNFKENTYPSEMKKTHNKLLNCIAGFQLNANKIKQISNAIKENTNKYDNICNNNANKKLSFDEYNKEIKSFLDNKENLMIRNLSNKKASFSGMIIQTNENISINSSSSNSLIQTKNEKKTHSNDFFSNNIDLNTYISINKALPEVKKTRFIEKQTKIDLLDDYSKYKLSKWEMNDSN